MSNDPLHGERLRIAEIFGPTIQGEGALIGVPTVFVRTGGCDFRCAWCDSMHAVDSAYRHEWLPMTPEAVFADIETLAPHPLMVTLSGGNPAIQDLGPLIALGRAKGYRFGLETQGSVVRDWFADLDLLTLSPKPPSSGMETDWDVLTDCIAAAKSARTVMKIVVFDEADYLYAQDVARRYPVLEIFLQPGNHTPPPPQDDTATVDHDGLKERMLWLIDRALGDHWYAATILPQLHVTLWGNKRGV